jgi:uroporphyrinogen-III synthase
MTPAAAPPTPAPSLRGTRVAVLEARMGAELAALIERWSGVPYCVPAVRETGPDRRAEVRDAITWLGAGDQRLVVLLNRSSVDDFFRIASEVGLEHELLSGLARAEIVCRGPKPIAALRRRGLIVPARVEEPKTSHEVVVALEPLLRSGQRGARGAQEALVLQYGERNIAVVRALERAGVRTRELSLYEWELPADLTPLLRLVDEVIERRVGAVAFTSPVQVRHLVAVAGRAKRTKELLAALRTHTLVAALSPACAEALRTLGIPPRVVPESPKMGPLVQSIASFLTEARA